MSYDLYVNFSCRNENDVDTIVGDTRLDVQTRIRLLAPALGAAAKDYARTGNRQRGRGYKSLVSAEDPVQTQFARELISAVRSPMLDLALWQPHRPNFSLLPSHSAFLQFQFTLSRPYLSRDDETFHINDNPVRKDKVFKVPMVAGSSWKGNLRWTATHLTVMDWQLHQDPERLADERFRLTRLFGDEKGAEGSGIKGLAEYLDKISADAVKLYCEKVRAAFGEREAGLPHYAGWLRFYPTFFDRIGLEVINPHDRATRAGKQPIYLESVPVGASGVFSLLCAPFGGVSALEAGQDLQRVAVAVAKMMRVYGFSAKKTSGFGEAEDKITGHIWTARGDWPLTKLSALETEVAHVEWS